MPDDYWDDEDYWRDSEVVRMTKVQRRRLEELCELLEKLPRKKFNYGIWGNETFVKEGKEACGSKACALGWATTIPSCKRAGLVAVMFEDPDGSCGVNVELRGDEPGGDSVDAACKVFGLDYDDAYDLFVPEMLGEEDATPKQVAKKIRKFLKQTSSSASVSP